MVTTFQESPSVNLLMLHNLIICALTFCYAVIDLHLQKLNNCLDVVNSDLLLGMTSLNPDNSFGGFEKSMIMSLAEYNMNEFDSNKL